MAPAPVNHIFCISIWLCLMYISWGRETGFNDKGRVKGIGHESQSCHKWRLLKCDPPSKSNKKYTGIRREHVRGCPPHMHWPSWWTSRQVINMHEYLTPCLRCVRGGSSHGSVPSVFELGELIQKKRHVWNPGMITAMHKLAGTNRRHSNAGQVMCSVEACDTWHVTSELIKFKQRCLLKSNISQPRLNCRCTTTVVMATKTWLRAAALPSHKINAWIQVTRCQHIFRITSYGWGVSWDPPFHKALVSTRYDFYSVSLSSHHDILFCLSSF